MENYYGNYNNLNYDYQNGPPTQNQMIYGQYNQQNNCGYVPPYNNNQNHHNEQHQFFFPQQQQQQPVYWSQQHNNRYNNNNGFQHHKKPYNKKPQTQVQNIQCRCDPCEKDFTSQTSLEAHKKTHVKCDVPSCTYVGSSKAVKLHFIQTHEEGKFRICLTTPEDIKKWREERRRNWPSKTNVERKKEETEDSERKGIHLSTKEFTYNKGVGKNNSKQKHGVRERQKGRWANKNEINNKNITNRTQSICSDPCNTNLVVNFTEAGIVNNDESAGIITNEELSQTDQPVTGLALLKGYDEDEEIPDEGKIERLSLKETEKLDSKDTLADENNNVTAITSDHLATKVEEVEMEDGELVENENENKLQQQQQKQPLQKQHLCTLKTDFIKRGRKNTKSRNKHNKEEENRKVSLLEMLLANEIRHERNVILQCVRFIAQNDFLQQ